MTLQAGIGPFLRALIFEREDKPLPPRIEVFHAGTMACLAPFFLYGELGVEEGRPVRIFFLKRLEDLRVTRLTPFRCNGADVFFLLSLRPPLAKGAGGNQGQQDHQAENPYFQNSCPIHRSSPPAYHRPRL